MQYTALVISRNDKNKRLTLLSQRKLALTASGIKKILIRGVLPWLFWWTRRAGTIDFCPALAALVSPVQNIFSSQYTLSLYSSPTRPAT
jgi:hypothetical protein